MLNNTRYLIVATSDAVDRPAGPAILYGNLATVRWLLSRVKVKTKFDPSSIFWQVGDAVCVGYGEDSFAEGVEVEVDAAVF